MNQIIATDGWVHTPSNKDYILDTFQVDNTSKFITAFFTDRKKDGNPNYVEVLLANDREQALKNHEICKTTKFSSKDYRPEIKLPIIGL